MFPRDRCGRTTPTGSQCSTRTVEQIRKSGVRKIGEIVNSSGMHITLLAKNVPPGFITWLRNQDRDPSRLFIDTGVSCPAVRLTGG